MHPLQHRHHARSKQCGAALIVMLVILVMSGLTLLVNSLSKSGMQTQREILTADALAQAKDALIGYAITYGDTHDGEVHGYLPCPDMDGSDTSGNPAEGSSKAICGNQNVSQIGRLPWKTLGLGTLRDGNGECLWYAVSGTYKNSPNTGLMNWDTNGQLQVYAADGSRLDGDYNQVVAVIFSPGATQNGQNRSSSGTTPICGGNYTASAYLENDTTHNINNTDITTGKFIQPHEHRDANGNIILTVNDKMLFITRQDIWNAMLKRSDFAQKLKNMTKAVAACLADYSNHNNSSDNHSLPWPAPLALSDYSDNDKYNDDDNLYQGRVPHRVNTSKDDSNNNMGGERLMTSDSSLNCPHYSASPSTELERLYPWWNNWKDHLFYALSYEYRPRNEDTSACSGNCVSINGSGNYAAVVMFAGSALPGKNRASTNVTNSERGVLSNYLEGRNESNYPNNGGNDDYQTGTSSATFNDVLYCIDTNLNVIECP